MKILSGFIPRGFTIMPWEPPDSPWRPASRFFLTESPAIQRLFMIQLRHILEAIPMEFYARRCKCRIPTRLIIQSTGTPGLSRIRPGHRSLITAVTAKRFILADRELFRQPRPRISEQAGSRLPERRHCQPMPGLAGTSRDCQQLAVMRTAGFPCRLNVYFISQQRRVHPELIFGKWLMAFLIWNMLNFILIRRGRNGVLSHIGFRMPWVNISATNTISH